VGCKSQKKKKKKTTTTTTTMMMMMMMTEVSLERKCWWFVSGFLMFAILENVCEELYGSCRERIFVCNHSGVRISTSRTPKAALGPTHLVPEFLPGDKTVGRSIIY
jgi:hypothetical protein